jgi:hypothetical protein
MSERLKKILFAVGFILLSIGMGYGLYRLFFAAPTPTAPGEEVTPGIGGELPGSGLGGPITGATPTEPGELPLVFGDPAGTPDSTEVDTTDYGASVNILQRSVTQAVVPSADGDGVRFYNPEDGRFYRVNADGTITELSGRQFFNVEDVQWGNSSDQAILEFPDGTNVFYDFDAKQQVTLPKHWEDFEFAPDDTRVVAKSIGTDEANRFLLTANPDGGEAQAVEPLGRNADKVHVNWSPNSQVIAYAETGELRSGNEQEILMVGQNHENFRSIIAPGQDFLPNWSPAGKQIVFSVWNTDNGNRPSLWITSAEPATMGQNRRRLNLNTWADKCTWASESEIYCAVPQGLPSNSGLQRNLFATLPDDIYRINLASGVSTKINLPNQNRPVRQPVLNADQTKLFFSDAETGQLISYDLP